MSKISTKTKLNEIKSLTGLRGIAACLVVLYHLGGHRIGQGAARQFIEHGYLWVDLFFSLSGFVLALTYAKNFTTGLTVLAVRKYTLDRLARIFPLFWFVTLYAFAREHMTAHMASAAHTATLAAPAGWLTLVINLLLIQAWGLGDSIVGPGWSLSTEWAVSLVFPLLALWIFGRGSRNTCIAFVVASLSLLWLGMMPSNVTGAVGVRGPMDMTTGTSYAPMLRCFADFTLGMIALRLSTNERIKTTAMHNAASLVLAAVMVVLLAMPGTDVALIFLFPIFIISVSFGSPIVSRVLASRPVHHVGKISYSLYLIHTMLIPYDVKLTRALTHFRIPAAVDISLILSIALAIGVATLTYQWIEVPGRLILRRWFNRWRGASPINPMLTPP